MITTKVASKSHHNGGWQPNPASRPAQVCPPSCESQPPGKLMLQYAPSPVEHAQKPRYDHINDRADFPPSAGIIGAASARAGPGWNQPSGHGRDWTESARCRESLALCDQLTSQAAGVLDQYMQRIDDLDRIIQPVAQRTQVHTHAPAAACALRRRSAGRPAPISAHEARWKQGGHMLRVFEGAAARLGGQAHSGWRGGAGGRRVITAYRPELSTKRYVEHSPTPKTSGDSI